jgi:predicted metal-dependent HD superfamily phosphohydrolase
MNDERTVSGLFGFGLFPPRERWAEEAALLMRGVPGALEEGPRGALLAKLERDYESPPRSYHIFGHALETARIGFAMAEGLARPLDPCSLAALAVAALCHDVVYARGARDNEEKSAVYASDFGASWGIPAAARETAARLVLATKHEARSPATELEALIRDADLSVLASARPRYEAYAALIRQESGAADAARYVEGRRAFLESFLSRARLFYLDDWAPVLERRARANLADELASLGREL